VGDPGAIVLLSDVVGAGFCQPQLFEGLLESTFADDPAWPEISERMARNVPSPRRR
jgi:hypothetical protein